MRIDEESAFLEKHGPVIQLRNLAGGSVLVSPQYQGRELETSSPAGALKPGGKLRHRHKTFHFVGDREALEPIALASLGVSLGALDKT